MSRAKKITIVTVIAITTLTFVSFGILTLINSRTLQLFGGLIDHAQTQHKVVALTFDDGPTPGNTEEILDTLARENVIATFMLIGDQIRQYPDQAKKIVAAGHQIGNHSYTHQRMVFKPMSFYREEVEKTDAEIRATGYTQEIVFRPPFGKKLFGLPLYLSQHHRKTIMWNIEPESYSEVATSTDNIVRYTVDNTQPGSIILLHGMYATGQKSRDAIGPIIEQLKAKGYEFVSVSDLIKQQ